MILVKNGLKMRLNLIKKDVLKRNPRENIVTRPFRNDDDKFDLDFLNIGFMSSEFHNSWIPYRKKCFICC